MSKLTEKQKQFIDEYLIDFNATRAYKEVYKNIKNDDVAAACASKLLRNAKVKSYIDKQLEKIHSEKIADVQEVMEHLTNVLRGESKSEVIVVEGTGNGYSAARLVKKAPDEKERLKAAELLGKRYGLFKDKLEMNGGTSVIIVEGEDKLE